MVDTKPDFFKIWSSNSPLTPYTFTDSDYLQGWNFIGSTPPARGMFDAWMKSTDTKMKWLCDNAIYDDTVDAKIADHNTNPAAHLDIRELIKKAGLNLLKRNKAYAVGDIAYSQNLPSWAYLECEIAGTTANTEPNWGTVEVGNKYTDGTVGWVIRKVGSGSSENKTSKIIFTANDTFIAPKTGTYYITAVAGGGGGTIIFPCGGGSGQSCIRQPVKLTKGEEISILIGGGGAGINNINISGSSVTACDYTGENGGNTVFGKYLTLVGGKGGKAYLAGSICTYYGGEGESKGGCYHVQMYTSSSQISYCGGDGGNSIFGSGGMGGFFNYVATNYENGSDAICYGAGGGGGGVYAASGNNRRWTAGGNGAQGVLIIEEE